MNIYIASKMHYAPRWRQLRHEWLQHEGIYINSRWIDMDTFENEPDHNIAKLGWTLDEMDVHEADMLLLYAEPEDKLRGALVEAGMMIALRRPVILVGENERFGTWRHHPLVFEFKTLEFAKKMIDHLKGKK